MGLNITGFINELNQKESADQVRDHLEIVQTAITGQMAAEYDFTSSVPTSPSVEDAYISTTTTTIFGTATSVNANDLVIYTANGWTVLAIATGYRIYNTTAGEHQVYNGSAWVQDNIYTDAEASKLAGIEAGADVTDATNVAAAGAAMVASLVSSSFGLERQATAITATGTLTSGDYGKTFPVDATSGDIIITIPDQSALKEIGFYRTDNSANSVSIIAASWQGVIYPGASTVKLAQYEFVKITSDGTNYFLSGQHLYTSPFVKTILDAFDAAAFRSDIGLGDVATLNTISDSYLDSGITSTKVSLDSSKILVGNGSNQAAGVSMSGDATIDNTGALTIANSAVTNAKILDATILQAKIGDFPIIAAGIFNISTNTSVYAYNCTWSKVGTGEARATATTSFPANPLVFALCEFDSGVSVDGAVSLAARSTSYVQFMTQYSGTPYNSAYLTFVMFNPLA